MKDITLIAAIGKNLELGKNNELIWHLPEDLKFFKEQTLNKPIIMGKNTLKSLPKMLPNRLHLVLTHQNLEENEQLKVFHTKEELLEYIKTLDSEVMVIGGGQIYKQFLPHATKLILTEIEAEDKSEEIIYFPKFNKEEWDRKELCHHEHEPIKYTHVQYTKR